MQRFITKFTKKSLTVNILLSLLVFLGSICYGGTVGKISGQVTDALSGDPLIGANVIVEGTSIGAATDFNGYFVILNVKPGTYDIRSMMIGYSRVVYTDVIVSTDLTTVVDFALTIESIQGEEVYVISERKAVKEDVASSQVNISSDRIADLPVTSVAGVIGLQAGVEGTSIRQGSTNELAVRMDGAALKDDRTGRPILGIPLSSVQEIMIQSGGFNAEYSDMQAGIINVVTKEGGTEGYTFNLDMKYSPAAPKHHGISIYDPDSYYLRPYLDDDVCWTGTQSEDFTDSYDPVSQRKNYRWDEGETFVDANGDGVYYQSPWDEYTQKQYPAFAGWIKKSEDLLADNDPSNDLSPEGAKRLFEWQHRRKGDIVDPDYNIDFGFGGPVPIIGKQLGNLRFFTSYKQETDVYLIPLSRDAYQDYTWTAKFTSDISPQMKLQVTGLYNQVSASSSSGVGSPSYFESLWEVASVFGATSQTESKIWYPEYYCLTDLNNQMYSAKLTHMLGQKSYYESSVEYSSTSWHTYPGAELDTTLDNDIFPGESEYLVNDAPYGFDWQLSPSINSFMMGAKSNSRDSTNTSRLKLRFDFTTQANSVNQIKTGIEVEKYSYEMSYGAINPALPSGRPWTEWNRYPYQIGAYLQDKMENKGWIATVGLRAEYFNPNGEWYDVDPYSKDLYSKNFLPEDEADIPKSRVDGMFTLLPRLGISHPITTNSKLYFNYGHMRQKFLPDYLFGVRRTFGNAMNRIGNPAMPMEKTVMYELGYDQALFNDYLLHAAAYYKDKSDQASSIYFESADKTVRYYQYQNNSYQDIRGLEIELRKRTGKWLTGFVNYTYSVYSSGYFGVTRQFQNPSLQREHTSSFIPQSKPLPRARVNFNLALHIPNKFGPQIAGQSLLGGWNMNIAGYFKEGAYSTYGSVVGVSNNVRWKDTYGLNFSGSKGFTINRVNITLLCNIYNLLNVKFLSTAGFGDQYFNPTDANDYYDSLHFPQKVYDELGYDNIAGNDRKGDYRPFDVDYQAMQFVYYLNAVDRPDVIYYVGGDTEKWYQLDDDLVPQEVAQSKIDKLLDDKAYIDNPNNESFIFLNPRDIYLGLKISFNI